jgi:bifunctional oligoribonuclease and PAP phosphatase NrnA
MSLKKIIQTVRKNKTFLISTHLNPDPDAICSELAMAIYLRSLGKKVLIINNEEVPSRFNFFPGTHLIKTYRDRRSVHYDVAIILDCGELSRIGTVTDFIQKGKKIINIDHHITNDYFGDVNLVKRDASSTAEVLYELFVKANCVLNRNMALLLYIGIMTDTGSFRYENTTFRTHKIAGKLLAFNFSATDLYRRLYETVPLQDMKAFTKLIGRFDTFLGGRVICIELNKKIVSNFSDEFDLRDTIFKFLRSIKDAEAFMIFTEITRHKTRVNFRSSNRINVAKLAKHFQGGGHRRASGCMIAKNIKESRKAVLQEIKKALNIQ